MDRCGRLRPGPPQVTIRMDRYSSGAAEGRSRILAGKARVRPIGTRLAHEA